MGAFAWVTLATNDSYSLGALVLAHSLKQAGTAHQLAVLVTPGVTNAMREKLASVFNVVQEVNILDSRDEENLKLLKRPELGITFTKLHCWRLTQFEKCVFLDADTLVLQNSDELFDREELSAAPDVGWPDCFNSGVYVYRPSKETYDKLVQFALEKGSFDGGDQGLLNLYFSDWAHKDISKHLPFIYNMCSTACYSYLPAFKQFGANAKIIHFIGPQKPWLQYFNVETKKVQPSGDSSHLQEVLQRWWDIFCSLIHPHLSPAMAGLAGAFSQLTLGVPRTAEQDAVENVLRKQAWEVGNIDYLGKDSFANIWSKITQTLGLSQPQASAPEPEVKSAPAESQSQSALQDSPATQPPADTTVSSSIEASKDDSLKSAPPVEPQIQTPLQPQAQIVSPPTELPTTGEPVQPTVLSAAVEGAKESVGAPEPVVRTSEPISEIPKTPVDKEVETQICTKPVVAPETVSETASTAIESIQKEPVVSLAPEGEKQPITVPELVKTETPVVAESIVSETPEVVPIVPTTPTVSKVQTKEPQSPPVASPKESAPAVAVVTEAAAVESLKPDEPISIPTAAASQTDAPKPESQTVPMETPQAVEPSTIASEKTPVAPDVSQGTVAPTPETPVPPKAQEAEVAKPSPAVSEPLKAAPEPEVAQAASPKTKVTQATPPTTPLTPPVEPTKAALAAETKVPDTPPPSAGGSTPTPPPRKTDKPKKAAAKPKK